eukprot:668264-Pelagomonas_calceolata.AAC.9
MHVPYSHLRPNCADWQRAGRSCCASASPSPWGPLPWEPCPVGLSSSGDCFENDMCQGGRARAPWAHAARDRGMRWLCPLAGMHGHHGNQEGH